MTTYGMVMEMHDDGVSSYYKPFPLTIRGAGSVHAAIVHSPPPRDMFEKKHTMENRRGKGSLHEAKRETHQP